jgi:IclR family acetate operon transcriptional repressor
MKLCRHMTTRVRSLALGFAILRLLAASGAQSLTEIARAMRLNPSSCLNLLRTLVDEGAVDFEGKRKTYRIAAEWANSDLFGSGKTQTVIDRIKPLMAEAAKEASATIGLWQVIPGQRVRLIAHAECDAMLRIQLAEGQRQPLGSGAVGRALAAAQGIDDGEIARRFAEVKWQKAVRLLEYIDEVRLAQSCGYAVDEGTAFAGVCTIAVALPDLHPGFCVSASLFSGSRSAMDMANIGAALQDIKHAISGA